MTPNLIFVVIQILFISEGFLNVGTMPETLETRIVGGSEIDITEAPYIVALLRKDNFMCGGVIISATVILTAAHCLNEGVANFESLRIRAGATLRDSGGSIHTVRMTLCHPLHSFWYFNYDVALLPITPPIQFDNTRQPINISTREPDHGDMLTVSGWGRLEEHGEIPRHLRSVTVNAVSRDVCRRFFDSIRLNTNVICYGTKGRGHCRGDSGGPVVQNGELVGIVMFSATCFSEYEPGGAANLADDDIVSWLQQSFETLKNL